MRRMYSEQELTKIIGEVFDQKIEAGAFNESIADAVDDYLTEHPIDITALEGLDISVGSLTATGAISGASIIETMSGYSASVHADISSWTKTIAYVGACKNGNKLTLVACIKFTLPADAESQPTLLNFTIPSSIGEKLIPINIPVYGYLDQKNVPLFTSPNDFTNAAIRLAKNSDTSLSLVLNTTTLSSNTEYLLRYEVTFLLSNSLIS